MPYGHAHPPNWIVRQWGAPGAAGEPAPEVFRAINSCVRHVSRGPVQLTETRTRPSSGDVFISPPLTSQPVHVRSTLHGGVLGLLGRYFFLLLVTDLTNTSGVPQDCLHPSTRCWSIDPVLAPASKGVGVAMSRGVLMGVFRSVSARASDLRGSVAATAAAGRDNAGLILSSTIDSAAISLEFSKNLRARVLLAWECEHKRG